MTDATVATDIHESLDVQLYLRAQITFHFEFVTDDLTNAGSLVVAPVFHFDVLVHFCFLQDDVRSTATNPIDISEGNFAPLVLRQIDTYNSYCHICFLLFDYK